jgi:hypothetical protein
LQYFTNRKTTEGTNESETSITMSEAAKNYRDERKDDEKDEIDEKDVGEEGKPYWCLS